MRRYTRGEWSRVFDHILGERLPGGSDQDIHELSATQRFVIGAHRVLDDRAFRYARIGTLENALEYGLGMASMVVTTTRSGAAQVISGAIHTFVVTLAMAGVAVDDYKGGWMGIQGPRRWGCRIISNTATDAAGNVIFTLEYPLPFAIVPATHDVAVTPNQYTNVIRRIDFAGCYHTFVGVAVPYGNDVLAGLVNGYYLWLQTWGPLPQISVPTSFEGALTYERKLCFGGDGAMQTPSNAGAMPGSGVNCYPAQTAGYLMPESEGVDYSYPVIFLTISP